MVSPASISPCLINLLLYCKVHLPGMWLWSRYSPSYTFYLFQRKRIKVMFQWAFEAILAAVCFNKPWFWGLRGLRIVPLWLMSSTREVYFPLTRAFLILSCSPRLRVCHTAGVLEIGERWPVSSEKRLLDRRRAGCAGGDSRTRHCPAFVQSLSEETKSTQAANENDRAALQDAAPRTDTSTDKGKRPAWLNYMSLYVHKIASIWLNSPFMVLGLFLFCPGASGQQTRG